MTPAKRPPATVVSLADARKQPAPEQAHPLTSASKSGYMETWYAAHEEAQGLVQATLKLQKDKERLERQNRALTPSVAERGLYYVAVFGIVATLLAWAGLLMMEGL